MSRTRRARALCALALAIVALAPTVASADSRSSSGGSDTLATTGACDAGSTWRLSGRSRYLRIDVETQVQTRRRGRDRWDVRLQHNQATVATRSRKPTGSGIVKLKGRVGNAPGPDTFTLIARNRRSGETCQGTLTF